MSRQRTFGLSGALAVITAFASNVALAAEHGADAAGHHAPHVANWWGIGEQYAQTPALGWVTVTFLIFVGALVYFARKPLTNHLVSRADTIETAIKEAQAAKAAAEARARDAEEKLAALAGEVDKMKADFESQGKAEADRIKMAAKDMAKKISRDAEDTINAEIERAREQLRAEASRLALQLAEERIKQMLTAADDDRLKGSLISELSA